MVECYSPADVRAHLKGAHVVLLDIPRFIPFLKSLTFLNKAKVFKAIYYCDIWRPYELDELIKPNVHLVPVRKLVERYRAEWLRSMFWTPASMDVQEYDLPRDIDVLFWGTFSYPTVGTYPFREFVRIWLKEHIVDKISQVDPHLAMYHVEIGGRKYVYALLKSVPGLHSRNPNKVQATYGYYGERLYRLVSRSKICCAGPKLKRGVPLGKYFENAACGAVSISREFTDREALGFEHKKNIWITGTKHFASGLTYLLEHDDVVREMSGNARELIRARHTRGIRARELYKFLSKKTGKV